LRISFRLARSDKSRRRPGVASSPSQKSRSTRWASVGVNASSRFSGPVSKMA
jgi:hypothetical protein